MKLYILVISFSNIYVCHNAVKKCRWIYSICCLIVTIYSSVPVRRPMQGRWRCDFVAAKSSSDGLQGVGCSWLIYQNDVPTWIGDVDQKSNGVFIGKQIISISLTSWVWYCAIKQVLNEEYQTFLMKRHHFYSLDALDPPFVKHWCTLLHCYCEIFYHILDIIPP